MAFQDYLGLEKYIKYCQESWWNLPPIIGIMVAIIGGLIYNGYRKGLIIDGFEEVEDENKKDVANR